MATFDIMYAHLGILGLGQLLKQLYSIDPYQYRTHRLRPQKIVSIDKRSDLPRIQILDIPYLIA